MIPNRNRAHSIIRAALSVLHDSKDIEVIIVDDCSDHDISDVYTHLTQMGARVFYQPRHMRGGAARNRGVQVATGTHISFLDSDDVWMPGRYARIARHYAHPAANNSVLVSPALLMTELGIRKPRQPKWRPGRSLVEYAYRDGGRIQTSMLNMPADIARATPWDESLRVNQDTDFAMRLDHAGIAFHIDSHAGVIKDEIPCKDRVTHGRDTADLSYDWYRRVSSGWSAKARSGYHLQDRVWRLAEAGRRREAMLALWRSLRPPVSPYETMRRGLSMIASERAYDRLRQSYRSRRAVPDAIQVEVDAAETLWLALDDLARNLQVDRGLPPGAAAHPQPHSDRHGDTSCRNEARPS